MLTQHNAAVIDGLSSISVPAIVIVGGNDKPFLNAADYMAKKIPGAKKIIVPDAGHAVNLDQPAAFNAAVLDFLDRLR
jgi:pimeloyl-ACP methyl ester carboxylesterase